MFVPVTCKGLSFPHRNSAGILRWSLAVTLCLMSCIATAANDPATATPSSQTTQTGEQWPAQRSQAEVSGQLSAQVSATPAVAPALQPAAATSAPPAPAQAQAPALPNVSGNAPNQDAASDADPEALNLFRADLDPYGSWVDDPRYGRIWIPNRNIVGSGFSPYVTAGHWALDGDDNWVWVSDYPFGNVVFHYGRWFYSAEYGWAWVPGRTYAPSWVIWRTPTTSSYAYVGWAPMPPRFGWFSSGVVWYSSMPPVSYVFCPSDYLFYPSVGIYVVHDPWLVGRLGLYTAFYYPPYGYYGWGYYGYGYGGRGYYHTHHYGPPVYRTGISQRAIPRDRVAARPHIADSQRAVSSSSFRSSSGRVSGSPGFSAPRSTLSATPRSADRWTAPRTSPLARSTDQRGFSSAPRTSPLARSTDQRGFSSSPRSGFSSAPRSNLSTWSAPRSTLGAGSSSSPSFRSAPSSSSFRSAPSSSPSFRSAPSSSSFRSAPSSSPSFRSAPSFHSSPSFRSPSSSGGSGFRGRHR